MLTLALALAPAVQAQITDAERIRVAERLKESTVTILAGRSTGSGFLVGDAGWVVTNAHVASGARLSGRLGVRFGDRRELPARLLAYDPTKDLAIAQIQGEAPGRPLPLGDSDAVKVGETVLAFGSPFGLDGTLTQGIVSAIRDLSAIGRGGLRGVIQTDAPINPGNSGGPLVNRAGQVVGVNTAILSRGGGSNGIGFAVPIRYVKEMLSRVRAELSSRDGHARRHAAREGPARAGKRRSKARADGQDRSPVWLGIIGEDFRARGYSGVRVMKVVRGSPAHRAGLLGAAQRPPRFIRRLGVPWTGHILLAVDSTPVRSMDELTRVLGRHRPGEQALVTVTVGPGIVSGETLVKLAPPPK